MEYDLVFEGGGAKGLVLVGACEEFFRRGHSFDRLLGTSAGAITATLLAAGYTPDEMLERARREGRRQVGVRQVHGAAGPFSDDELRAAPCRLLEGIDSLPAGRVEKTLDSELVSALAGNDAAAI